MISLRIKSCIRIFGVGLLGIALAGCMSEFGDAPEGGASLTLHLSTPGTRATIEKPGVDNYNENKIVSLDLFFYPEDADESTTAASAHKHIASVGNDETTVNVSLSELNNLLSTTGDTKFLLYAVANETVSEDKPTIEALKAVTIKAAAEYKTNDASTHSAFRSHTHPDKFVMTNFIGTSAPAEVVFKTNDKNPSTTVHFKRVAAKIRLALEVVDKIVDNGVTWKPAKGSMRLYINNGVRKGTLSGVVPALADDLEDSENSDYFRIMATAITNTAEYTMSRPLAFHENGNTLVNPQAPDMRFIYYHDIPYYTYPNTWTESSTEEHKTMLTIAIPWEKEGSAPDGDEEDSYQVTYYSVPLTGGLEIESNTYYYVKVHVGMKGSSTPDQPFLLEGECEICDWGDAEDTDVALRPLRILQFNQTSYRLPNESRIEIPFISTHDCAVVKFSGQFYLYSDASQVIVRRFDNSTYYSYGTAINPNGSGTTPAKGNVYDYYIDNQTNTLVFTHNFFDFWKIETVRNSDLLEYFIKRSRTEENDNFHRWFSKFDIDITVRHSTGQSIDTAYEETIHLDIYPPIYIETIFNTGDSGESGRVQAERGYVYVNGQDASADNFFGAYGRTSRSKESLTLITVSVLNEEEKANYEIGDPRTHYINNDLSDESMNSDIADQTATWTEVRTGTSYRSKLPATAPTIWGLQEYADYNVFWDAQGDKTQRTIKYYYPTSPVGTEKMVAPKFMIASEYAYTGAKLNQRSARRRCATYQELGFPAGRWRLPTRAERDYVMNLQSLGLIPRLFTGSDYSDAQGDQGDTGYIRCVYDYWYWQDIDAATGEEVENRIPLVSPYDDSAQAKTLYKTFMWGDRPKQNTQAQELINAYKTGVLH